MPKFVIFALLILLGGCASLGTQTPSGHGTEARAAYHSSGKGDPLASMSVYEPDDDDDEDETEVADADATPDDLGEVEISGTRRADEIQADILAGKTFPLVYNEFVDQWIQYFTGRGRGTFERWLQRSTRFIPVMRKVLKDEGLPEDLIYLAMIESGFNLKAASHAKAVGPWQFIKSTGERYDLEVDYWVDERRDFIKASVAAAQYLRELHQIFGSWYLAAASYNAGEGKVLNAVRADHSRNFWELARKESNFRAETRNYVPKIIAAALLSKNPEKYGFKDIPYEDPIAFEEVKVPGGVDLRDVATLLQIDPEYLMLLNSGLRRGITTPGGGDVMIRIPPAKKDEFLAHAGEIKSKKYSRNFATHRIRRGDTLKSIARRYGANLESIMEYNQIHKATKLKVGTELEIPLNEHEGRVRRGHSRNETISSVKQARADRARVAQNPPAPALRTPAASPGAVTLPATAAAPASPAPSKSNAQAPRPSQYVVRPGDTLWTVAQTYGISVKQLRRANRIRSAHGLQVGTTLVIPDKG